MKKLNIFIDESGDFGINDNASDLYVVSFVFLSSFNNMEPFLNAFKERLKKLQFTKMIHTADLIRHKGDYKDLSIELRQSIFNSLFVFTKRSPVKLKSIVVNKKYTDTYKLLKKQLTSELRDLVTSNHKFFQKFDKIVIYYDNGQSQLAAILEEVFKDFNISFISDFDKTNEKLFQVADMLTFMDKYYYKFKHKLYISKNEKIFFENMEMRKLLKELKNKRF